MSTFLSNFTKTLSNSIGAITNALAELPATDTPKTCASIGNIIIDRKMLVDIETMYPDTGSIMDPGLMKRVHDGLRSVEEKYNIESNAYMLTGFDSPNHFKINSISIDESRGIYTITDDVVGVVNCGVLEVQAIIRNKIRL